MAPHEATRPDCCSGGGRRLPLHLSLGHGHQEPARQLGLSIEIERLGRPSAVARRQCLMRCGEAEILQRGQTTIRSQFGSAPSHRAFVDRDEACAAVRTRRTDSTQHHSVAQLLTTPRSTMTSRMRTEHATKSNDCEILHHPQHHLVPLEGCFRRDIVDSLEPENDE